MASKSSFDPTPHLMDFKRWNKESQQHEIHKYLQVSWCLVWLRSEHPEATIDSEMVALTEKLAMFKATIEIPGKGRAVAHGSETPGDFKDYAEKAETKAIGRALRSLGFGAEFAGDDLEEAGPVVSPVQLVQQQPKPKADFGPQLVTASGTPAMGAEEDPPPEKATGEQIRQMYGAAKYRGIEHGGFDAILRHQGYPDPPHGFSPQDAQSIKLWIQKIYPAELETLIQAAGLKPVAKPATK